MENEEAEGIAREEIVIAVGWLNWRAIEKPVPVYPVLVEKARLGGKAVVEVLLDTSGNVERAVMQSGHPVVYPAVLEAARQAKFYPTRVNGQLVKVSGFLTYDLDAG